MTGSVGAMGAKVLASDALPVIDISALSRPGTAEFAGTARKIGKACEDNGFFYVTGHGVPQALIDAVYAQSKRFHGLPPEVKDAVHIRHSFGNRGWHPSSLDDTDPDPELYRLTTPKEGEKDWLDKPRLHAAFDLCWELDPSDPAYMANVMEGPNQWPELEGFKETVEAYYDALMQVGRRLFDAFAHELQLDPAFFAERTRKPTSQLRLLYYPKNDYPMDNDHLGISAHSDFECFTILSTGGPGLQVMNAEDEWVEAPPVPGAFSVNIGDMLEAWTNGRFKATQHRVINDNSRERYSLPLFFAVDYDTVVEPLPQFVSEENPAKYGRIVAGHHLASFTIQGTKHLRKQVKEGKLKLDFAIQDENPFKRKAVNEFAGDAAAG
ncbi:MAG: isopenicillin N synthase family oxygenase [Geminicoccaceae bacterium]|nr:MAG: isopenicillin N synthase family oxygenase [Geminicoccaceae bacterium]